KYVAYDTAMIFNFGSARGTAPPLVSMQSTDESTDEELSIRLAQLEAEKLRVLSEFRLADKWFELRLLIVLHPPPNAKPETVWDWDTPFPSAGLPSLGKRR